MRPSARHLALLAAIAILAALVALLLLRPPVAAPTEPASGEPQAPPAVMPQAQEPWTSVVWEVVPDPLAPLRPPLLRLEDVAAVGDLLIGWGRIPMDGRNQFNDMGAVFVSEDGRSWRAIPIDDAVNAANASSIRGVAAGPGGYLAFGGVCCEPESSAIWHSPDGSAWTRQEITGDLAEGGFNAARIVGGADVWVAAGADAAGTIGTIWASADGLSWDPVLSVELGMLGWPMDVAVTAHGFVAIATITGPDGTHDGAIWTSADGRDWQRVSEDDPALVGEGESRLDRIVPFAGGLAIIGGHGSTEDRRQCEGISMIGELPPARQPPAISCGWAFDHLWLSPDGRRWQRVDPADARGLHPIEFRRVVAGGPGLVLLGEASGPESPDTTLFTSPDGIRWSGMGAPNHPISEGVAYGLVVRGDDILAITDHFGGTTSQIRFWIGSAR